MTTNPAFVAASSPATANNTAPGLTVPSGVQAGDYLFLHVFRQDRATAPTPPSGFTLAGSVDNGGSQSQHLWYKAATGADVGATFTFGSTFTGTAVLAAWRGATGLGAVASNMSATSASETLATGQAFAAFGSAYGSGSGSSVSGGTSRYLYGSAQSVYDIGAADNTTGAAVAFTWGGTTSYHFTTGVVLKGNNPPNAPAVQVASTIDSGAPNVISAPFSDPDPGDSCSQTDFQWWDLDGTGARVGGPYTQTVTGAQPTQWSAPGGTFTNGKKEIQAKSYDALGVASPWGASAFFTAATPTGMPTITDPLNGGTVGNSTYTVAWTTAGGQVGYQVRRVADNAGAADATTVYWDSGQVTDANARSLAVPFETNNRWEHVQVSVTADGTLWSSWADARVDVSYTPPPDPVISSSTDPSTGSLLVSITNPASSGSEPATSYNYVEVDDGLGKGREGAPNGNLLPTNQPYRYMLPVSDRDYKGNLWVTAVGTNGVTATVAL